MADTAVAAPWGPSTYEPAEPGAARPEWAGRYVTTCLVPGCRWCYVHPSPVELLRPDIHDVWSADIALAVAAQSAAIDRLIEDAVEAHLLDHTADELVELIKVIARRGLAEPATRV